MSSTRRRLGRPRRDSAALEERQGGGELPDGTSNILDRIYQNTSDARWRRGVAMLRTFARTIASAYMACAVFHMFILAAR